MSPAQIDSMSKTFYANRARIDVIKSQRRIVKPRRVSKELPSRCFGFARDYFWYLELTVFGGSQCRVRFVRRSVNDLRSHKFLGLDSTAQLSA